MSHTANTLLRDYWIVLLLVSVGLALAALSRGFGVFLVALGGIGGVMWALVALATAIARPTTRPRMAVITGVFAVALVAVFGVLQHRARVDAVDAQRLVEAVLQYKKRAEKLPTTLADLEPAAASLAVQLSARLTLSPETGEPLLDYMDVWFMRTRHQYDFGTQQWTTVSLD